jgi:hypothetical protein
VDGHLPGLGILLDNEGYLVCMQYITFVSHFQSGDVIDIIFQLQSAKLFMNKCLAQIPPKGEKGQGDQLDVLPGKRDADDGDGQHQGRGQVGHGDLPSTPAYPGQRWLFHSGDWRPVPFLSQPERRRDPPDPGKPVRAEGGLLPTRRPGR